MNLPSVNSWNGTRLLAAAAGAIVALSACNKPVDPVPSVSIAHPAQKAKIAFMVKQPDEHWFQLEWQFASQAASRDGFTLLEIPASNPTEVVSKIEAASKEGAKGLIICSPDVRLGPQIKATADRLGMKLLSVDDQLVGPDGKFLDVPHMGISASKIGTKVGETLVAEMNRRGWQAADTGLLVVTLDSLDTAKQRTDSIVLAAVRAGFPADHVYRTPQETADIEGGLNAAEPVLKAHHRLNNWLIAGMNDATVIGAVRATEGADIPPFHVIGIGINGDAAMYELKKPRSGVYGSILLQAKRHGFETADLMYHWIHDGVEPPKTTYTDGILITRDDFRKILSDQGLPVE